MDSHLARRRLAAGAALTVLGVALAACAGTDSDSSGSAAGDSGSVSPETAGGGADTDESAPVPAEAEALRDSDSRAFAANDSLSVEDTALQEETGAVPQEQSLISTGNVALRADDVGQARFDVQKVVDALAGEVAQEKTEADKSGEIERARMVLRVPSADFAEAMESLEGVAGLISTRTNVDDVTTEVIDTDIRVELQRRSIDRIQLLLDRAESIRDIVSIESQLSRRQADLGSLEQQQAYLADQTSMATITVSLERTPVKPKQEKVEEEKGFFAGLDAGWTELKEVTVTGLTASGAVLPFALVLLLLAIPGVPLLRRLRRRVSPATPTPAEA